MVGGHVQTSRSGSAKGSPIKILRDPPRWACNCSPLTTTPGYPVFFSQSRPNRSDWRSCRPGPQLESSLVWVGVGLCWVGLGWLACVEGCCGKVQYGSMKVWFGHVWSGLGEAGKGEVRIADHV